jgi:uncharacterized protein YacL
MREKVLKAVASPPKFLWAPYLLAAVSLGINFALYIFATLIMLAVTNFESIPNPVWLILSIVICHLSIAAAAKKEPHLSTVIQARLRLSKTKNLVKTKGNKYLP